MSWINKPCGGKRAGCKNFCRIDIPPNPCNLKINK